MYSNNVFKSYVQWSVNLSTMLFRSPTLRECFTNIPCCIVYFMHCSAVFSELHTILVLDTRGFFVCLKLQGPDWDLYTSYVVFFYAMNFWFLEHKIDAQSMMKNTPFSSPEPKSQVSFHDHLLSSVRLSVKFSRFRLLFQNHQGKLGTIMWEANSFKRYIN